MFWSNTCIIVFKRIKNMNKVISFSDFTEDVTTYVDFVMDSGNEVVVNECENRGVVIIPIEEYNSLKGINCEISPN